MVCGQFQHLVSGKEISEIPNVRQSFFKFNRVSLPMICLERPGTGF
jgi:hypothetical protein